MEKSDKIKMSKEAQNLWKEKRKHRQNRETKTKMKLKKIAKMVTSK